MRIFEDLRLIVDKWYICLQGRYSGDLAQIVQVDDQSVTVLRFSVELQQFANEKSQYSVDEFRKSFCLSRFDPEQFDSYVEYAHSEYARLSKEEDSEQSNFSFDEGAMFLIENEASVEVQWQKLVMIRAMLSGYSRYWNRIANSRTFVLSKKLSGVEGAYKTLVSGLYRHSVFHENKLVCIQDGKASSDKEPFYVMNQIMYFDEEIAGHAIPNGNTSITFFSMEDLDTWVTSSDDRIEQLIPYSKGVVVMRYMRPRSRNIKKPPFYHLISDPFVKTDWADEETKETYILVRNGEKIYRAWIDLKLDDHFIFSDWESTQSNLFDCDENGNPLLLAKEAKSDESRTFLTWLEGVLQSNLFEQIKVVNVCNLSGFTDGDVVLVSQDSAENKYEEWRMGHLKNIKPGARVLLGVDHGLRRENLYYRDLYNTRMSSRSGYPSPPKTGLYEVKSVDEDGISIMYKPDDGRSRTRRITFKLFWEDWFVFNFDALEQDALIRFMFDRSVRLHHWQALPALWDAYTRVQMCAVG